MLSFFFSCALLKEFLGSAVQQPTVAFRNAELQDVSLGGLTLDTVWVLSNPNAVGVSLASVDYALFVENQQVLAGAPKSGLQIPAQGQTELHFPTNIKFAELAGVVATFLTKDTATWRVEGSLGVQTPLGILRLPIAQEGHFEVPKVPTLAFGNPRVTTVTFQGATIEFPLVVTNKNTYALPVAEVTGTLAIAGSPLGTLSSGNLGAVEGKGSRQVVLPLHVSFIAGARAWDNALRGESAQVTFKAQLQSGPQTLPVNIDQLVNFLR